jgi:hypothetical protein
LKQVNSKVLSQPCLKVWNDFNFNNYHHYFLLLNIFYLWNYHAIHCHNLKIIYFSNIHKYFVLFIFILKTCKFLYKFFHFLVLPILETSFLNPLDLITCQTIDYNLHFIAKENLQIICINLIFHKLLIALKNSVYFQNLSLYCLDGIFWLKLYIFSLVHLRLLEHQIIISKNLILSHFILSSLLSLNL